MTQRIRSTKDWLTGVADRLQRIVESYPTSGNPFTDPPTPHRLMSGAIWQVVAELRALVRDGGLRTAKEITRRVVREAEIPKLSNEELVEVFEGNCYDRVVDYRLRQEITERLNKREYIHVNTRFDNFDDPQHPANIWWQKFGQFMMAGGGRREFIWACRGWIAREKLGYGTEINEESLKFTAKCSRIIGGEICGIEYLDDTPEGAMINAQQCDHIKGRSK